MDKPQANTDSQDLQDSPWPGLGGIHHLPLYSIFYAWPQGEHPNVILSQDSQVETPKIFEIEILATLKAYNFLCRLPIEMRSQAKLYPSSKKF
jgi:hypothetical protein